MRFIRTKLVFVVGLLAMLVGGPGCPQPYRAYRAPEARGQSATQAAVAHVAPGRVYDPQEGFSIQLPPGWRSNGPSAHHFLNYLGPVEGPFTVNFNVLGQPDDGTPIEQAKPKVLGIMPLLLKNYRFLEEGFTTIGDRKAYYAVGRFTWEGQNVINLQYFIRGANKRVYILTFAAPSKTFVKHRPVFEETAKTVLIR